MEGSIVLGRAIDEIASLCGKRRLVVGVGGFQSWDDWLGARGLTRAPVVVLLKEIRTDTLEKKYLLGGWEVHPSSTLSTDIFLAASVLQPVGDPQHLEVSKLFNESNQIRLKTTA